MSELAPPASVVEAGEGGTCDGDDSSRQAVRLGEAQFVREPSTGKITMFVGGQTPPVIFDPESGRSGAKAWANLDKLIDDQIDRPRQDGK